MDDARKRIADAIVVSIGAKAKPKGERSPDVDAGPDAGLIAAMDDFLAGIDAKDSTAMAAALENAYDILCPTAEEYED